LPLRECTCPGLPHSPILSTTEGPLPFKLRSSSWTVHGVFTSSSDSRTQGASLLSPFVSFETFLLRLPENVPWQVRRPPGLDLVNDHLRPDFFRRQDFGTPPPLPDVEPGTVHLLPSRLVPSLFLYSPYDRIIVSGAVP